MFSYNQYDRVCDTVMYFTDNISLTFTVLLSKNLPNGGRRFFEYEIDKGPKTSYGETTRNINRRMNFFFTLNIKDEFGGGFLIRPGDAYMLLDLINSKVLPWFYADNPLYAFQIIKKKDKGTLTLKEYNKVYYTQTDVRHLGFEPVVITNPDDTYSHGIKITINGLHSFDITLDKFMEFVRFLNTDMYAVASSMVNYAKMPPYGTNIYQPYGLGGGRPDESGFDDVRSLYETQEQENKINNSSSNSAKSFLDNVKRKE